LYKVKSIKLYNADTISIFYQHRQNKSNSSKYTFLPESLAITLSKAYKRVSFPIALRRCYIDMTLHRLRETTTDICSHEELAVPCSSCQFFVYFTCGSSFEILCWMATHANDDKSWI